MDSALRPIKGLVFSSLLAVIGQACGEPATDSSTLAAEVQAAPAEASVDWTALFGVSTVTFGTGAAYAPHLGPERFTVRIGNARSTWEKDRDRAFAKGHPVLLVLDGWQGASPWRRDIARWVSPARYWWVKGGVCKSGEAALEKDAVAKQQSFWRRRIENTDLRITPFTKVQVRAALLNCFPAGTADEPVVKSLQSVTEASEDYGAVQEALKARAFHCTLSKELDARREFERVLDGTSEIFARNYEDILKTLRKRAELAPSAPVYVQVGNEITNSFASVAVREAMAEKPACLRNERLADPVVLEQYAKKFLRRTRADILKAKAQVDAELAATGKPVNADPVLVVLGSLARMNEVVNRKTFAALLDVKLEAAGGQTTVRRLVDVATAHYPMAYLGTGEGDRVVSALQSVADDGGRRLPLWFTEEGGRYVMSDGRGPALIANVVPSILSRAITERRGNKGLRAYFWGAAQWQKTLPGDPVPQVDSKWGEAMIQALPGIFGGTRVNTYDGAVTALPEREDNSIILYRKEGVTERSGILGHGFRSGDRLVYFLRVRDPRPFVTNKDDLGKVRYSHMKRLAVTIPAGACVAGSSAVVVSRPDAPSGFVDDGLKEPKPFTDMIQSVTTSNGLLDARDPRRSVIEFDHELAVASHNVLIVTVDLDPACRSEAAR